MFPEITRDEVFRIETPRLWLRWPVVADADALAVVMASNCVDGWPTEAFGPEALRRLIAAWRADMEVGTALHLVIAPKAGARTPVGIVHTGKSHGCVSARHVALGREAAEALRAMVAVLGGGPASTRSVPPMAHQRPAPVRDAFAPCCVQA